MPILLLQPADPSGPAPVALSYAEVPRMGDVIVIPNANGVPALYAVVARFPYPASTLVWGGVNCDAHVLISAVLPDAPPPPPPPG